MTDPIVDEVRRIRDAHAAQFNYDLHAIFLDIKKREKERGLEFVDGVACQPVCTGPSPPQSAPNKTLPPPEAVIPISPGATSAEAAPAAER